MRTCVLVAFLAFPCAVWTQSDTMYIGLIGGETRNYPVSSIRTLTFSEGALDVNDLRTMEGILRAFTLHQNYPNPFNPETTIAFDLESAGDVTVDIYNVQGRLVRSLLKAHCEAGAYRVVWDAQNGMGQKVASGMYFCRARHNNTVIHSSMLLLK